MKKTTQYLKRCNLFILLFLVNMVYAQLHAPPSCGENYTLDWSSAPSSANEFNWSPNGALTNTFSDVDGSGIDFTITFTGETSTLGIWGAQTPKVGNFASGSTIENLDLYTNGFSSTGITCTITFNSPIYALSFDLNHVNAGGANGDKYTITATTTSGGTIYPTFTSSTTPSYTADDATGVINANSPSTTGDDAVVGINFLDDDYITSVTFLWQNCNTCSEYAVHGSGLGNFSFCIPQTLDFDGVNDYIDRAAFLGGKSEVTMMTWMKLDNGFDSGEIMGQRNFRLYVDSNKKLRAFIKPSTGSDIESPDLATALLNTNLWYHATLKFDGNSGKVALYLNGGNIWEYSDDTLIGTTLNNDAAWNSNHDFEIGRNTEFDNDYFEGSIYECRVYSKALTTNQIQRQVHQEIENNSGNVRGTVIPKDIEGLLWDDLELYYKMETIEAGYTPDKSNSNIDGHLNNMRTHQERTAPLPFVTTASCNGDWFDANNWVYGDVWDIDDMNSDAAIVKIIGDLQTNSAHKMIGLILDSGSSLEVNGDNELNCIWYLKLDGDIDLQGESQLVQGAESTLAVNSSGTLERDQQGTRDLYTYNYWSSPVGISNTTSNNNNYTLSDILNDASVPASPMSINFLKSGYSGTPGTPGTIPVGIADYWIWKYANKTSDTYSQWQHVRSTGNLLAGEGFTMKGVHNSETSFNELQNYAFNGKPNNGDISLTLSAGNDYLIGNPYPSAIDANEFILDNISDGAGRAASNIFDGALYFWDHFAGNTHILREYQGGYAIYNLMGGIKATSTDARINASGAEGTKIPQQYIPVSQGFFITADAGGSVTFKNSQRIFKTEASDPSLFLKGERKKSNSNAEKTNKTLDNRQKIRLMYDSPKGYHRQLLVGVDENATNDVEKGYDAPLTEDNVEDMFWVFNENNFVIQAVNNFDENQVLPIGIKTNIEGVSTIKIDGLENITSDVDIYFHDKELNIYQDLKENNYDVFLSVGEYLNRFEITFVNPQTLNTNEVANNRQVDVYFSNEKESVIIHNPSFKLIESVEMFNILGQALFKFTTNTTENYIEYNAKQIKTGAYILKINTEYGKISKKVLIE